jgi:hypothetical protein
MWILLATLMFNQMWTLLSTFSTGFIKIVMSQTFGAWMWIMVLAALPVVKASPVVDNPFPDITFKAFNEFIKQQFSSKISLSTVLVILFSLTENPDLLNLHARQQYVESSSEHRTMVSGWIKSLARALKENINQNQAKPLKMKNMEKNADEEHTITAFSLKLDALAKLLGLHPYNHQGQFQGKLKPVSHTTIQPVHVICPIATECETQACNSRSLLQLTPIRDVPQVTLIKNSVVYENVLVLTGQCSTCQTKYLADHERAVVNRQEKRFSRVYLNTAKYLKVGQSLWVDRLFSNAVVNGVYSFHASANAYTEYWNNTFQKNGLEHFKVITRRQVWQAFIQETIRSIAATSNEDLVLQDGLAIDEVTKEAFAVLGNNGVIAAASQHSCSECTHEYKRTADTIANTGSAAGIESGGTDEIEMDQQENTSNTSTNNEDMEIDKPMMTMAVLDGIVMGPTVC